MTRDEELALIREILEAIARGRPPLAARPTTNPAEAYISPARHRAEWEALFCGLPLVAGFSSEVRSPGDWLTDDLGAVPLIVVRNAEGELRAFANACRHRGARVVEGRGTGATRLTCPYHAWSYDLEGRLRIVPEAYGFEGASLEDRTLLRLPVAERHGLVWVHPDPTGAVDLASLLGGLDHDLERYGIGGFQHQESRLLHLRMNWKLASDTFWEAYHLRTLHQETVGPLFPRNVAIFHPFGRHHRFIGPRASIATLRERPEAEWDLVRHATILMNLFPNTVLVMQTDHAEVYRILPVRDRPGECAVEITLLVPDPGERWKRTMELLLRVVGEDFAIGEGVQRNLEAGSLAELTYGRFENALEHFHATVRQAIERSPS